MPPAPPQVIAFGSCRKHKYPQPVMDAIARLKPDAWLWTGDYLYFKPTARGPTAAAELEENYVMAATTGGERTLRAATPIIDGVYDDHDYGENDAGGSYEHRELARRLFLDEVVGAPADSPRRTQPGGIYGVRTIGSAPREIKVLMLDTRFARGEPAVPSVGAVSWMPSPGNVAGLVRAACALFGIGSGDDILGSEAQWAWLEHELTNSSAAAHLLVSSVQVLTTAPPVESWGHFPRSRRRLLELLQRTRPSAALFLSGDVHFAEFLGSAHGLTASATTGAAAEGAALLEVTSSGLTHACGDKRLGWLVCHLALGLFDGGRLRRSARGTRFAWLGHDSRLGSAPPLGSSFTGINFGTVVAHWEGKRAHDNDAARGGSIDESIDGPRTSGASAEAPHLAVRIHDVDGEVAMQHRLPLFLRPEAEAARWEAALAMPTIFDDAAFYRTHVAILIALPVAAVAFARCLCRSSRAPTAAATRKKAHAA